MSPSESDPGCSVAWYDDRSRTEFVGRYANSKQFQRDLQMAAARGWFVAPADQATINAAGSSNEKVTVTFQRAPDWLAAREREMEAARRAEATRAADDREAALVMASEALARAEETFASLSGPSAATDELTALAVEQALLTACKDMVAKRRRVIRTLDEAVREMATAVALGVSEFAPSLSRYQAAHQAELARLESEFQLLPEQEAVVRAAREWHGASGREHAAAAVLAKRRAEREVSEAALVERLAARNSALKALPNPQRQSSPKP